MKYLINFLFFLALFPEASFFPVSTNDTQPLFPLLAFFYLIIFMFSGKIKLDIIAKYLLLFVVSSLLMINLNYFEFGKYISIFLPIFAFSIYFFSVNNREKLDLRVITIVIQIYLIVSLIQQFLPQIYVQTFTHFLSIYRWEIGGSTRGNNSLTVEPSHMAVIGAVLYLISKILLKNSNKSKWFWINTISLIIIEYLTKSVYSYLFFLIVLIDNLELIKKRPKFAVFPVILLVFVLQNLITDTDSRFGSFFQLILENPANFFADASFAMRLNAILYGLYSMIFYPFGMFRLEYIPEVLSSYSQSSLINLFFPEQIHQLIIDFMTASFTGIGPYFIRMGLVFLMIVIGLCYHILKENKLVFIVFIFYLLNLSIISAPIWILLSLIIGFKSNQHNIKLKYENLDN